MNYLSQIVKTREDNFKLLNSYAKSNSKFMELNTSFLDVNSNFAFPLIFDNKKDYIEYRTKFIEKNVEIRPIVSGNIVEQPFFKKYLSEVYELKNASYIHENGFYFPNNPDLAEEELEILIELLK